MKTMILTGDKVPPQSIEAEQSVLGSMIIEKEAVYAAAELLHETDFYRTAHQKIFKAVIALSEKGEPVDLVTLADELQRQRSLEEAGGTAYLSALAGAVPTAANVQYYALIVREKSILRSLIHAATGIVSGSYEGPPDVEEFLDEAEQKIFEIGRQGQQRGFIHLKEVLKDTFDRIEMLFDEKKGVTGLST
ncbi:MAG: replicative DNA helicase, partial [Firmicutes bacterium]|nr:replicative DNA helicase [Bacillota bacterium]